MPVNFKSLEFGQNYDRHFLAKLWGYKSRKAIERGVVTPVQTKFIILFVTKIKRDDMTQYNDYIDGDLLFWDGESGHVADQRVIATTNNDDEIHLFYRDIGRVPFIYFGKLTLLEYQLKTDSPSKFVFRINSLKHELDVFQEVREHAGEYKTLNKTEQQQIVVSRLGQGNFRRNVIRLWGSCSVTGLQNVSLLRASHIKPWKDSNNDERLTPYNGLLLIPDYDFLFDRGYITFKNSGDVLVSPRLSPFARKVFDVRDDLQLRRVFPENKEYLEFHRSQVFE
jgi:hypothetical protein